MSYLDDKSISQLNVEATHLVDVARVKFEDIVSEMDYIPDLNDICEYVDNMLESQRYKEKQEHGKR